MSPFRTFTLVTALVASTACATQERAVADAPTTATAEAAPREAPDLVEALPTRVGSLEYQGFKYFSDDSGGFSLRYSNKRKRRLADVYVYPVAEENQDLAHKRLVLGSTQATMRAIGEAVRQGIYANFNVLAAATKARGLRTVARVQATYLRKNLASYTLVYQTEHDGTLLKIRLSMPDNESNRNSAEWDEFAERLFDLIERDLDGANA